jgi:uncharacterized protein (TIGR02246 family)
LTADTASAIVSRQRQSFPEGNESSQSMDIEDKFAIHELIARYNHAIDGGDPDGVAACFANDGTFQGISGFFAGRAELRKLGMTLTEALIPRHVVSNVVIAESEGDVDTAHIKSHLFYYEVTPEGFYFKTSGIYTDVVVRAEGAWKFRSRLMTLDVAKAP